MGSNDEYNRKKRKHIDNQPETQTYESPNVFRKFKPPTTPNETTPLSKSKTSNPCASSPSSSSSLSSVLSSQNSSETAGYASRFRISDSANPGVIFTLTPLPGHENSCSPREDVREDPLDLDVAARRLFERHTTREPFHNVKALLKPILLNRLKELSTEMEPKVEIGLEMADSVYLLKLLSSSNPELESVGTKAGRGAMLLQEGLKLVTEGKDLIRSAIMDLSTSTE